jgi:Zn-dependent peptidase ImmA (M78 family)
MAKPRKMDRRSCEQQAEEILRTENIDSWPVRIDRLAKGQGIKIRYEPLDDELSGMCFYKDGVPVVGVNARHAPNRQRFTIAHELGHIIMHDDILQQGAHVDKTITMLRRDPDSAQGVVEIEIQANQFAAAILMPDFLIQKYMEENNLNYGLLQDEDVIDEMAKAFKVSSTALAIRMGTIFR